MKIFNLRSFCHFGLIFLSAFLFSCSSAKKIKYFQDIPDSGQLTKIAKAEYTQPVIQTDDILTIIIQTLDPAASQVINTGNVSSSATGTIVGLPNTNQQVTSGYLVDKDGNVDLPVIGRVKVVGRTTSEAKDLIAAAANKQYNNLQGVIVRYANFKVSITGEVNRPGSYIMPNEKVSILDAIALAGDLTIYGKRENILLLRENEDGTRTPFRVDLRKSNVLTSPYFYLRQNDILYVEPTKAKAAANDVAQARNITIISSALSVLIILFSRI